MTHTVKTWPSAIYNGLLQIPAKSRDIPPFQGTKHQSEQWTHWKLKIIFVFSLLCQWEAIWEKCLAEKYIWSGEPAPLWSRFSIIKMMEWAILELKEVQALPLRFYKPPAWYHNLRPQDILSILFWHLFCIVNNPMIWVIFSMRITSYRPFRVKQTSEVKKVKNLF